MLLDTYIAVYAKMDRSNMYASIEKARKEN